MDAPRNARARPQPGGHFFGAAFHLALIGPLIRPAGEVRRKVVPNVAHAVECRSGRRRGGARTWEYRGGRNRAKSGPMNTAIPAGEVKDSLHNCKIFSTELVTSQEVEHENIRFRNPFNSNNFCYYARVQ